jgi:hypothetical protein
LRSRELDLAGPKGATEGFNRLTFGLLRVAHFDPPPPDVLGNLDELLEAGRVRFVNRLEAWVEVEDGRIVDAGQAAAAAAAGPGWGYGPASIAFASAPMPELRQLSLAVIDAQAAVPAAPAGRTLVRQGEQGQELFLLFDGVLQVEVDGEPVTQVGPGEMALLQDGRRTATLRAVTPAGWRSSPGTRSTGRRWRRSPRAASLTANPELVTRSLACSLGRRALLVREVWA